MGSCCSKNDDLGKIVVTDPGRQNYPDPPPIERQKYQRTFDQAIEEVYEQTREPRLSPPLQLPIPGATSAFIIISGEKKEFYNVTPKFIQ